MHIRRLELKDAPLMMEWMHDQNVVQYMYSDFGSKTIDDAIAFIEYSQDAKEDVHMAIVSDEDEYMGTISLKHIENGSAEFGLVVRTKAMSRGYSWMGMKSILEMAFDKYDLQSVYWCVRRSNKRAIRFYDKHYFHEAYDIPRNVADRYVGATDLKWYSVLKGDDFEVRDSVAGCKVIRIATIPTVDAGELSFFEANCDVGFDIKRIYYISKVPEGVRRGFHAHKELKQVMFCPYGKIQLVLENKDNREEIELSDPSIGVVIDSPTWREMLWLQKDSVLCVAASEYYDANDYIRDYEEFRRYIEST